MASPLYIRLLRVRPLLTQSLLKHPLSWLPLASLAFAPQCVENISNRCELTLTCEEAPATSPDASVRAASNGGGASFAKDAGQSSVSAGDAGQEEGNCLTTGCDGSLVCDTSSEQCFTCLSDEDCASAGGADASTTESSDLACDLVTHTCVACTDNSHCSGTTPYCETGSQRCVECLSMEECTDQEKPACNQEAGECTATCTEDSQCVGATSRCLTSKSLCVECLGNGDCSGGQQCNLQSNQCVACVDNSACDAPAAICDTQNNVCVSCLESSTCTSDYLGVCSEATNRCVQCTTSDQCTEAGSARCNQASYDCTSCNLDSQCDGIDGVSRCRDNDGRCVQCIANNDCSTWAPATGVCELGSGSCVQCTDNAQCSEADKPRCDTNQWECAGCLVNNDCDNVDEAGPLCRVGDGLCVSCLGKDNCNLPTASRCNNDTGTCAGCVASTDCEHLSGRQACNTAAAQCVECVDSGDCGGDRPICDTGNNTCVECIDNSQCGDPSASRCEDRECTGCRSNVQLDCGDISDSNGNLNVCDASSGAGLCVECTGLLSDACGDNVCNSLAKTCSDNAVGSADKCGNCVASNHCSAGFECVLDEFNGTPLDTFRCFPIQNPQIGCGPERPLASASNDSSIEQQPVTICRPGPATTCSAFRDVALGSSCALASECGEGNGDGVCPGGGFCGLPCRNGFLADCFPGSTCQNSICLVE